MGVTVSLHVPATFHYGDNPFISITGLSANGVVLDLKIIDIGHID